METVLIREPHRSFATFIIHVHWIAANYTMSIFPPFFWQVWGKFFAALDNFSSEHQLLLQSQCIKQRVFILLINAITLDIKEKKIDRSVALNIILQLCELIESFILIIHPSTSTDEGTCTCVLVNVSLSLSLSLSLSPPFSLSPLLPLPFNASTRDIETWENGLGTWLK